MPIAGVYLGRQTVEPGQEYQGIVFAKLPRVPEPGDSLLLVEIETGGEAHVFQIRFVGQP
jgi:hypothetical protein